MNLERAIGPQLVETVLLRRDVLTNGVVRYFVVANLPSTTFRVLVRLARAFPTRHAERLEIVLAAIDYRPPYVSLSFILGRSPDSPMWTDVYSLLIA